MVIGKKIPAVSFADRESKYVTKFYHAVCNSKLNEILFGLPAAGVAIFTFLGMQNRLVLATPASYASGSIQFEI